jgi:hypothetical protein
MKYFNSLPILSNTDSNGNSYLMRNLLIRTDLIPQLAKNPLVYYQYELREGDTPESVAQKYYGDQYRYWIVLYGNPDMLDPQGDWPLSSKQFLTYLQDKYSDVAGGKDRVLSYVQGTTHHYEKIITTTDNDSQTTVVKNVDVDQSTYNLIIPKTQTQTFPNGSSVTQVTSKTAVSIYDYENNLNEAKRNINLIKSSYANQMETQFKQLVNA